MTVRDAGYVIHTYLHNKEKTRLLLLEIYEMCSKIIPISSDAIIETLYSNHNDFEDGLVIEAANESMCDAIITSDKKGFKKADIPVYSLDEINNRLRNLKIYVDR